jgi:hypothetical protein
MCACVGVFFLFRMCGNEDGQYGVGGERVTSPDNIFKFTSPLSADYFFAPSAPALAQLAAGGSEDGAAAAVELPPVEGVSARNKRRRSRYFVVCENCREEAPHTAEEGADVGLCLLCHRLRPYDGNEPEAETAAM